MASGDASKVFQKIGLQGTSLSAQLSVGWRLEKKLENDQLVVDTKRTMIDQKTS
ncbi:hypothetical protein VD0004_g2658 [Verticillium dahliae]|nr:hypothetical protein VD0004_g2658 [Verticillium dahliae]PNH74842.1 hypothetical protein VD0001_g2701 [Verticillium dahliae]